MKLNIKKAIDNSVWDSIIDSVEDSVWEPGSVTVNDSVWDSVKLSVKDTTQPLEIATEASIQDYKFK
jgi:hypothetical protein